MKLNDIMPIYYDFVESKERVTFSILGLNSNDFPHGIFIDCFFVNRKECKKFRRAFIDTTFSRISYGKEYIDINYDNEIDSFRIAVWNTSLKFNFRSLKKAKKAKNKLHENILYYYKERQKKLAKKLLTNNK